MDSEQSGTSAAIPPLLLSVRVDDKFGGPDGLSCLLDCPTVHQTIQYLISFVSLSGYLHCLCDYLDNMSAIHTVPLTFYRLSVQLCTQTYSNFFLEFLMAITSVSFSYVSDADDVDVLYEYKQERR